MGGASRAWAVGDAGPLLNPSGMSLLKTYTVEGATSTRSRLTENYLHASIVDGTSTYNIAGGIYYTYHVADPAGGIAGHGHEGGLALSLPFGEMVALGATVKYFRFSGDDAGRGQPQRRVHVRPRDDRASDADAVARARRHQPLRRAERPGAAGDRLRRGVPARPQPAARGRRANHLHRRQPHRPQGDVRPGRGRMDARAAGRAAGGRGLRRGDRQRLPHGRHLRYLRRSARSTPASARTSSSTRRRGVETPRQTVVGISLRLFVPAAQTQQQPQ